jgi:adenosine deaminase
MMSGPNHQEHKENHLTSLICSIFEHLFGSD